MTISHAPMSQISTPIPTRGATLLSTTGESLPLRETHLATRAQGGLARVQLTQTFVNTGAEPLRVSYLLPLPENAAVSGFSFSLDGVVTHGVVKTKRDARADFEEALMRGQSAAILEEESSTLFRQEVGNVPPGAEIVVTVELDQKLVWHATTGAWEWRFPTVVAPRFYGASIPDAEVDRTKVHVADLPKGQHLKPRARLDLRIGDELNGAASSPSHRFCTNEVTDAAGQGFHVSFLDEHGEGGAGVPLDRDVVVRWPVAAAAAPGVSLSVESAVVGEGKGLYGLLTLVPPVGPAPTVSRDLIVLLDTSGSMGGEPLAQAVEVVSALVDSLGQEDQLELIEFSSSVSRWKRGPRAATPRRKASAQRWLRSLSASGSTNMHEAILDSLGLLGAEAQRQVLIVTDGLIGGERQLVDDIAKGLPRACRVHTLGIGHGVNRTLTAGAARAGRGVEQIVAPGEDAGRARAELLAAMNRPVLVDLELSGSGVLETSTAAMDVYAGTPSLIPVRLESGPDGRPVGTVRIEGRTADGTWTRTLDVSGMAPGSGANAALFARERVQQLEAFDALRRTLAETDAEIERLGLDYQIATRRTSWVAISEARTVDPMEPTRTVEMPHELGAGLSAEGLGLRAPSPMMVQESAPAFDKAAPMGRARASAARPAPKKRKSESEELLSRKESLYFEGAAPPAPLDEESLKSLRDAFRGDEDDAEEAAILLRDLGELVAKVLLHRDGGLVVAFTAPETLAWADLGTITVEFEDGSRREVTLNRSGSTFGLVKEGAEVRMVLAGLPEGASPRPVAVRVEGSIRIRLTL